MRVVLDRNRGGSFITSLLVGVAIFGMFLFLTYYMQGTLGFSALTSGFAFLPFSAGVILSAGLASKLLPRFGPRPVMSAGLVMGIFGMGWLTQLGVDTSYVTHVLPSEILLSVGMGLVFVPLSSTALTGVESHDAGVASAMVNTTQQVGGSLGTALLNTIVASTTAAFITANGVAAMAEAQVAGYTEAFKWGAVIMTVALIVTVTMINAKPQPKQEGDVPIHVG
jgi:MFS family permease